jgi:two-component system, NtrC family, response regulator HydG
MQNRSLINTTTDANFHSLAIDEESRDFVSSVLRCSEAFIEVMKQVSTIAETNSPVLLTGESGNGKELVASAIHNRSSRRDHPFVTVNCASMPAEELFESFTGADGGTIFLEEITETTPSFQEKLLHVLQTDEAQKINVRVIAASNRNVEQEIAEGRFRNDLFNCFSAVSIALPPLREHPEDIPPLAQSEGDEAITAEPANDDWVTLSVIEGRYVARVLEHTSGNKQAAARVLAVDRKTLDRMIKRHHIDSHHLKALRAKAFSRS